MNRFQEKIRNPLIRNIVERSFGVKSTKQKINLKIFHHTMRILRFRNMHQRFKLVHPVRNDFMIVSPFWFLKHKFKKKKLESVQKQLFRQSTQKSLDEESQKRMISFLFEVMVGQNSHPVDNQSNFLVEHVLLILETLLSVFLSITKVLFFFELLLLRLGLLSETWKEVIVAGVAAVLGKRVRGVTGKHHSQIVVLKVIWVVGDKDKIFVFTYSRFSFRDVGHLSIFDQKWKELYLT